MKKQQHGMSLMEVLASIFVIGIGLLGALAIIPFGAYQLSKVRELDGTANMLAAAAEEVRVYKIAQPKTWRDGGVTTTIDNSNSTITVHDVGSCGNHSSPACQEYFLDCTRIIMIDPFDGGAGPSNYFSKIGSNSLLNNDLWKERLIGQDDLQWNTYENKRPDFVGRDYIRSSGRFTWFVTYLPKAKPNLTPNNWSQVLFDGCPDNTVELEQKVSVDVIGCHDRVSDVSRVVSVAHLSDTVKGCTVRLQGNDREELDLSKLKYLMLFWYNTSTTPQIKGYRWCKIVQSTDIKNATGSNPPFPLERDVTLIGKGDYDLSGSTPDTIRAVLIDGAILHMNLSEVPLYD